MTTETMEIRQLARQFAESDLRPHVEQWDHDGAIDDAAVAQLGELGFFGMLVPEAFGGMEFDLSTYAAALEELAWGEPGAALMVATAGSAARKLLHGAQGEAVRHRLEAIASAGYTKFVMHATQDGVVLVPTELAGSQSGGRLTTLGLRTVHMLRAAASDVPGALAEPSDAGRIGIAAISVGIAQAALDHALAYADVREQFGEKLKEFEGLQHKLADMAMRTRAARALLREVAAEPSGMGASLAKVFASETAMWVTTQAVQIFGGYGYMRDYPVEKLMRDAKAMELFEGSNEMQRVLIARELYR